jgi:heat-inducible transcriptional repressor
VTAQAKEGDLINTPDLDERKAAILNAVVTDYVETAQPVGSSQIARDPAIDVSPATVRADMADLERKGYLTHPHTSAGRVPTDKGYRFFVDHLRAPSSLDQAKSEQVEEFFSRAHGELERMLGDTTRLLARLTDSAAIVISPGHEHLVVRSALVTRLSAHTALFVLVLSNGAVEKCSIPLGDDVSDDDISASSAYIQQHFAETALSLLASAGGPGNTADNEGLPQVVSRLVATCWRAVRDRTGEEDLVDQVFVGGAARMAENFAAVEQVRAVLTILEESFVVVTLLKDVLARGSVAIGSEHGVIPLMDCSLVVAPYEGEHDAVGTIGVLGPTRMNYPEALAAVAVVGQHLSRELQRG